MGDLKFYLIDSRTAVELQGRGARSGEKLEKAA